MEAFRCIYFGPEDTSMNLYLSSDETGDRSDLDAQMENNPDVDERRYHYCAHCDFKSIYKASLSNHIRTIHQKQELIKCRLCSFETVDRRELLVHMKIHADVDKRLYQCAHCDIRYKSKVSLRAHIRIKHTKKGLIKCNLCDYRALYRSSLEVHMAKHKSEDEKSYKCPHCEYRSGLKSSIKRHIRIKHTRVGLINCHLCDHQALSKSALEVHMLKHGSTNEKLYQCPHCDFGSKYKHSLSSHIRIRHTRQGLIKCKLCRYEARSKSALELHMAKHMNVEEKPFKCSHCEYRTVHNFILVRHIRLKHGSEGLIDCNLCDYQALDKNQLTGHLKWRHSKVVKTS